MTASAAVTRVTFHAILSAVNCESRESLLVTQKTRQINNAYESRCRSAKEKQAHLSLEDLIRVERRSIVRWSRFEKRHVLSSSFAVHTLLL
jgi:hypothetical protein